MRLRGATIQGTLDLSWSELAQPLSLIECHFDEAILANHSTLKQLVLSGSQSKGINLDGATVYGNIELEEGFSATGVVRFLNANIGGRLSCRNGSFSSHPGKYALSADQVTVRGSVFLDEAFSATGEVRLLGASIGGDLSCRNGTFNGNLGDYAFIADGVKVRGSVFLDQAFSATGEVHLLSADIGGDLSCRNGTFTNDGAIALRADGMAVKGSVNLHEGFEATGRVRLPGATIGGQLSCRNGSFSNPGEYAFIADRVTVRGSVFLDGGFSATGGVRFPGARLGLLWWDDQHVQGVLDLRDATVPQLADDWVQPLKEGGGARLSGCRYESFVEGTDDSLKLRLAWLRSAPGYTPQPYTQLAAVYRSSGHDDRARKVLIAREVDRRKRGQPSRWAKAKSLLLGATVAHGYEPARAVLFLVVLWVIGVALLLGTPGRQAMVPTKPAAVRQPAPSSVAGQQATGLSCPPRYPCFNPWIYSAETVVPLIELGQTANWQPTGGVNRYHIWVWTATGLGWLFTTLGLAGVTGAIRND